MKEEHLHSGPFLFKAHPIACNLRHVFLCSTQNISPPQISQENFGGTEGSPPPSINTHTVTEGCILVLHLVLKGDESSLFVPLSCSLCSKRERFLLIRAHELLLAHKKGTIPPYSCHLSSFIQKNSSKKYLPPKKVHLVFVDKRLIVI